MPETSDPVTVIEVSFLTGRYSATGHHDREACEWPPHGARLFSAMVANWADGESPGGADDERAVLEWLEAQPAPAITAPDAVPRRVASFFVPVNDARIVSQASYDKRAKKLCELNADFEDELEASGGEITKKVTSLENKIARQRDVEALVSNAGKTPEAKALALLPDGRLKKERFFPSVSVTAESERPPTVVYAWDENPPADLAEALDRLLTRVTRLGHSSSLVSCRLLDEAPSATHLPSQSRRGQTQELRWVSKGQLSALEERHRQHQGIRPRNLPSQGIRYREVDPSEPAAVSPSEPDTAGEWILFELEPQDRRAPMTRTVELTQVLRDSILSWVDDPLPEGVSGHLPDGRPTPEPHISFLALPNVGHEHADGRIMGLAVSLPGDLEEKARRAALRGIGKWEQMRPDARILELRMGSSGLLRMKRIQSPPTLVSLRSRVWARPSRRWVSATPVALPIHPGVLHKGSPTARAKAWARAEEAVARSCEHVGLPRPVDVQVSFSPFLVGARPAGDYPAFRQGRGTSGQTARRLLHARVEFAEEVRGPLVLGSGRFLGLGLMRPVDARAPSGAVTSREGGSEMATRSGPERPSIPTTRSQEGGGQRAGRTGQAAGGGAGDG